MKWLFRLSVSISSSLYFDKRAILGWEPELQKFKAYLYDIYLIMRIEL